MEEPTVGHLLSVREHCGQPSALPEDVENVLAVLEAQRFSRSSGMIFCCCSYLVKSDHLKKCGNLFPLTFFFLFLPIVEGVCKTNQYGIIMVCNKTRMLRQLHTADEKH